MLRIRRLLPRIALLFFYRRGCPTGPGFLLPASETECCAEMEFLDQFS